MKTYEEQLIILNNKQTNIDFLRSSEKVGDMCNTFEVSMSRLIMHMSDNNLLNDTDDTYNKSILTILKLHREDIEIFG